ncbi:MAG: YcaO-like family protein [Desulfonauticus sp.]|nr:YcaO-like family protein [Desulfonauticus sp.]
MFKLHSCPKSYTNDLDKACPPEFTVKNVSSILKQFGTEILFELKRIDTGRLGIPVYMSICGHRAKQLMPSRKQMGKGSSPAQAKASALMELVERFSFFYFEQNYNFELLTYTDAKKKFPEVLPVEEILRSVQEDLNQEQAITLLDLVQWKFVPSLDINTETTIYLPFNWFKLLNEYNGSSAGNSYEESILQGLCELIERHVCAIIEDEKKIVPTLNPASFNDPILKQLWTKFINNGIKVWLKDFSLDFPVPTIAALAYDPKTFPHKSEIVFTAGTATSPAKAAIRALTEVAQLAGDFETKSSYEPSGLSKYNTLEELKWIIQGNTVNLNQLPTIEQDDIYEELKLLSSKLQTKGFLSLSIDITHPKLQIPANYNIIPGLKFRERTKAACLGLFIGRSIAENEEPKLALKKLEVIAQIYPDKYFIPFFKGLIYLRSSQLQEAKKFFQQACILPSPREERALSLFYLAYSLSLTKNWSQIPPILKEAIALSPEVKEYHNLLGVALFKQKKYEQALIYFKQALKLDKGSAIDLANIGMCYKNLGHNLQAALFLQQALELDPTLDFAQKALIDIKKNNQVNLF